MEGAHPLGWACYPVPKGKKPTPRARLKDTLLTALFVMVDDFAKLAPKNFRPGRARLEQEDRDILGRYLS